MNLKKASYSMKYLIIFSVLIGFTGMAFAVPEPLPEDDFIYSDHVVTGKIISSEIIIDPREDNSAATFYDTIIYKVKVEKWHKNPLADDIITVYGTHFPNDVIPEPNWGVLEFEIGDTVYLYIDKTDEGLKFREYGSKILYSKDSGKTEITLSPLKQFKSGARIDQIQCNEGFVVALKSSNGNPACVKRESLEKLRERGWAEPFGDVVFQRTNPVESDYEPYETRCSSGVIPYIPENWQTTGMNPSDETWETLGRHLVKQVFYQELQHRNIIFEPACFGVSTGFVEQSYPPRYSMCSMVTASNGTNIYLEGTIREFDVDYFDIDNKIPYQCDDEHHGCLCGLEDEN